MGFALLNDSDAGADVEESVAFRHRPVDLAHLSRYTRGNAVAERELLDVFRHQAKAHFERLRDAQDTDAWREAANLLKTSARTVGAWQIVNSAETAERIAMVPQSVRDEVLSVLRAQVDEANAFISTVLES
jgi:HPt (histidine-containing phosphotransfer) domain-containing protein